MRLARNVFRRKLRAFLTIFGITIGVFTLVVMGGMAEKISLLVGGGTRYYADKVMVSDASSSNAFPDAPLSMAPVPEIEAVDGVARASAGISMLFDEESNAFPPPMIIGSDGRADGYENFKINYAAGRALKPEDRGKVVVGSDLVEKLGAEVGKNVTIRGESFQVVGIMEKTLTAPDTSVSMSLVDAQRLLHKSLPAVVQKQVAPQTMATSVAVYLEPGQDPDAMAARIQSTVSGIKASGPAAFQEQVGNATKILNAVIYGIALISLLVGGLSVINTMTMSVAERTREIGIRKAIGASHGQVVRQFLAESGFIGLLGGISGLALGWAFTLVANAAGNSAGTTLFLVTGRLALGAVLFALVLGIVSGIYPSLHAARLNPVTALRYE
jgi:putative ABC transport system permease protein